MDTLTAIVLITMIVLFSGLVLYALYKKGDVRAGANVGDNSFFIEVKERRKPDPSKSAT